MRCSNCVDAKASGRKKIRAGELKPIKVNAHQPWGQPRQPLCAPKKGFLLYPLFITPQALAKPVFRESSFLAE
jgi:hypothetical protein